jgi:hypothetical protein
MRCFLTIFIANAPHEPKDLAHDPQKHGPAKAGLDTGFAKKIMLKQKARAPF